MAHPSDRIKNLLVAAIELRYMAADAPMSATEYIALAEVLEQLAKEGQPGSTHARLSHKRRTTQIKLVTTHPAR